MLKAVAYLTPEHYTVIFKYLRCWPGKPRLDIVMVKSINDGEHVPEIRRPLGGSEEACAGRWNVDSTSSCSCDRCRSVDTSLSYLSMIKNGDMS